MKIKRNSWSAYVKALGRLDDKAMDLVKRYIKKTGWQQGDDTRDLIRFANKVASTYGEGASSLSCEMYDEMATMSGAYKSPATPANVPTYGDVAKAINGTAKIGNPDVMAASIGRLVKQTGVDTTMQNALRDGAEWAWVPNGDTCAYCITLASRGWQRASKKALKNGHAEHIHANCDCTYAIRFDGKSTVEGYDPDKFKEMYDSAEGDTWQEKVNFMRREQYDSFSKIEVAPEGTSDRDSLNRFRNLPKDPQRKLESINLILDEYCKRDSLWSGVCHIVPNEELPTAWGKCNIDRSISLRKAAGIKTYIHELLHCRSSKHYSREIFVRFSNIEEGTVELFAQELCRANGIKFNMSYPKQTKSLRIINSIINPKGKDSIFDFAQELFDIDLPDRYNWLRSKISEARDLGYISAKSFRVANRQLVNLLEGR